MRIQVRTKRNMVTGQPEFVSVLAPQAAEGASRARGTCSRSTMTREQPACSTRQRFRLPARAVGRRLPVHPELGVAVIPSMDVIRDLAMRRPGTPVLSVYVRTDPRDPANTVDPPGWLVELRNGLREVSRAVNDIEPRDQRLALRDLRERVERDILALRPAERGRGAGLVPDRRRHPGSPVHAATPAAQHPGSPGCASLRLAAGRCG